MKLAIVGATGFVASEVIRQALANPHVTSLIAISRQDIPTTAAQTKLKSVRIDTLDECSKEVQEVLKDIDACVWTVSIGPVEAPKHTIEEIQKVNHTYPLQWLKMLDSIRDHNSSKPLRFLFMSGRSALRPSTPFATVNPSDPPMTQFRHVRGGGEASLADFAASTDGQVEVISLRPGIITENGKLRVDSPPGSHMDAFLRDIPRVDVDVLAEVLISLAVIGLQPDPMLHEDIVEMGDRLRSK